jgi:serine/threonine protein kinase
MQRRAIYDNFFVECRANGSLITQNSNGKFTPFCHGWITVPTSVEIYVARKFNIQPFLWDRPPDAINERVRGILFEWVDGKMLSQVQINPEIANQIRAALKGLHQLSIAHGDIRAANILVNNDRVYLIDLNSSLVLPHAKVSEPKLKEVQANELRDLEIGFALLSQVPVNQHVCVADMSFFGQSSLDKDFGNVRPDKTPLEAA